MAEQEPPVEAARAVFRSLGYDLSGEGTEFHAVRKWRRVRVTVVGGRARPPPPAGDPSLRCFVAPAEAVPDLRERLAGRDPAYEWAIVGVRGRAAGDPPPEYEVVRGG